MAESAVRIMLLVNEFPPEKIAGTAMATKALAENLAAKGHHVLVMVTTSCPEDKRHLIAVGDYELVWMQPRPLRGTGTPWRIYQAWRAARRFRPQIIQGQAVSCGLLAAVVGRWLDVPSICYAQGYDVYESNPWQQRTEIRWGCLWPSRLLAVTKDLAGEIRRVTGASEVQLMPHAFSLPAKQLKREDARAACCITEGERLVFCVGRLEAFKGHDVLLDAWQPFSDKYPEARLCIAGSGSLLGSLQQQAERLGIARSVQFAGHLSAEEVHQWMAAADLFVLPSRSEPFGIVLLEAMRHGLPVVASNVGGVPEVVPADGAVRLVPAD
ncbi:MAG: glycosyltransferase family 4 protein, partial [Mariprofundaceae bacterium]|nr:glycosyltransferase family 4 protein [Mariprofundaceae bacterium]